MSTLKATGNRHPPTGNFLETLTSCSANSNICMSGRTDAQTSYIVVCYDYIDLVRSANPKPTADSLISDSRAEFASPAAFEVQMWKSSRSSIKSKAYFVLLVVMVDRAIN